jgi:hypothetical protein
MEILRTSERPEDKLPIGEPAFSNYSQTPRGSHECLGITESKSHPVVLSGLVIPQECQNPFIVIPGRIDRTDNLLVPLEKILIPHLGDKVH